MSKKYRYVKKGTKSMNTKAIATRALNKAKKMERGIELKSFDSRIIYENIDSTANWTSALVSNIVQGDTNTTREGSKVRFTSIFGNIAVQMPAVIGGDQIVRVMIVLDRQPNGANLNLLRVLEVNNDIFSRYNRDTVTPSARIKILSNMYFNMSEYAANSSVKRIIMKKFYVKLNNVAQYEGNLGTVADAVTNAIHVFWDSDNTSVANEATIKWNLRLNYKEI